MKIEYGKRKDNSIWVSITDGRRHYQFDWPASEAQLSRIKNAFEVLNRIAKAAGDSGATDIPNAMATLQVIGEMARGAIEHDPELCGCESHSAWCPYNPDATELSSSNEKLNDAVR